MNAPLPVKPHGLSRLAAILTRPRGLAWRGPLALAARQWRSATEALCAQVLPGRCPLCAAIVSRRGLCPTCLEALTALPDDLCPGCGERAPAGLLATARRRDRTESVAPGEQANPVEPDAQLEPMAPSGTTGSADPGGLAALSGLDGPAALCPACRETPRPWDGLGFCGLYAGELRGLILSFKFGGGLGRADLLAGLLLGAYRQGLGRAGGFSLQGPELVTAAPLHPTRLLRRGYNQSFELARLLARRLGAGSSARAVTKTRTTAPQARLGQAARRENLRGVFLADPALVRGRRVLVVDDVLTTGATLGEVSLALKVAGAVRVEALVLAKDKKIRA